MIIAPSVLTADFSQLKKEIKKISNADMIHIDIMDGHFVPNISFGPNITSQIAKCSKLDLDVHLMVTNPLFWLDKFNLEKVKYITVHIEANDVLKSLDKIRAMGKKVGLCIKPGTKVEKIKEYLPKLDLVLVMSVEPGFGGQEFMKDSLAKITKLAKLRTENNYKYLIEVDGGINGQTAKYVSLAGADIAVCGSYVFNAKNPKKVISELKYA